MKECKIAAYTLRPRKSYARPNNLLDGKMIYDLFTDISKLPFKHDQQSKVKEIDGYGIALIAWGDTPPFNEEGLTRLKFRIGRITDETFPGIDADGSIDQGVPLEDGKKLCFLTHGELILRKIRGQTVCSLLLERRFHCIALTTLLQYLRKFNQDVSYEIDKVIDERDVHDILEDIHCINLLKVRNKEISMQPQAIGSMVVNDKKEHKLSATEITFRAESGATVLEQLYNSAKQFCLARNKKDEETEKTYKSEIVRHFIDLSELRVLGVLKGSKQYRWLNLFEDAYLIRLSVEQETIGILDSNDFFEKLVASVSDDKASSILTTSREMYDRV